MAKVKSRAFFPLVLFAGAILAFAMFKNSSQTLNIQNPEKIRQTAVSIHNQCTLKNPTCYQDRIQSELLDVYKTQTVLEAINDYDTYFSCHAFTHFIGRALYESTQSIPEAYSQINFTCHGGTYHGVIEAYLNDRPEGLLDFTGGQIEEICMESKTKTDKNPEAVESECFHGFGHAFMYVTDSNLKKSLELCDMIIPQFQERCFGGAFMENSTSSTNVDHPTQWLKEGDKFYPCTILSEKYLTQCYFYQSTYLLMTSDHNYQKVFGDCYTLDGKNRQYCYMGIGAILASVSNERSVQFASTVCNIPQGEARQLCIEGAVPSMLQRWGGNVEKIVEFCNLSAADLQEVCFLKLGTFAQSWYNREKLEAICKSLENYQEACMGTTNVKLLFR